MLRIKLLICCTIFQKVEYSCATLVGLLYRSCFSEFDIISSVFAVFDVISFVFAVFDMIRIVFVEFDMINFLFAVFDRCWSFSKHRG